MSMWRYRPGATFFVLGLTTLALMPVRTGNQDLGSLIARQQAASTTWRAPPASSPVGSIRVARFSLPQPVGTEMPQPASFRLASLTDGGTDITGSVFPRAFFESRDAEADGGPVINRALKGDRLTPSLEKPAEPVADNPAPGQPFAPVPPRDTQRADLQRAELQRADLQHADAANPPDDLDTENLLSNADDLFNADIDPSIFYFNRSPIGGMRAGLEPWAAGTAPILELSPPPVSLAALPPASQRQTTTAPTVIVTEQGGQTIAGKGIVTGAANVPKSPADRLSLNAKTRPKAEKCLADAIYFESRGENVRGQIAVAQVVMNRVFSGYYPNNVCGVVYQNSHRRLACQFTFACDGIPDRVNEADAWERAKIISRDTLDGKYWLAAVGKATHYHAFWVHPRWVREMRKQDRIGVHTFYRPRNWGDGADTPIWGSTAATAEAVKKL